MTKLTSGDVDIDCKDRNEILSVIEHIPAKRTDGMRHASGVYCMDIEFDPITGLASDDYESNPYTKIDFLNLNMLSHFNSNEEIIELMNKEPNWDLLKIPEVVSKLLQIHSHFDLVQRINPRSIKDLMKVLYKIREHSEYRFKEGHCLSYALNIVVMMNYIEKTNELPED